MQTPCHMKKGLTVVLARNPYDWLISLHRTPWNAPSHQGLDFETFIQKSWLLESSEIRNSSLSLPPPMLDVRNNCPAPESLIAAAHNQWPNPPPQNVYRLREGCDKIKNPWQEGLPQKYCGLVPAYEASNDGTPFRNAIAMRKAKLLNYLHVSDWNKGPLEIVSYDKLAASEDAPVYWIREISRKYDLRLMNRTTERLLPVLTHYKGNGNRTWNRYDHQKEYSMFKMQDVCEKRSLWTPSLLCQVNREIDWNVEEVFGFEPSQTIIDCEGNVLSLRCD